MLSPRLCCRGQPFSRHEDRNSGRRTQRTGRGLRWSPGSGEQPGRKASGSVAALTELRLRDLDVVPLFDLRLIANRVLRRVQQLVAARVKNANEELGLRLGSEDRAEVQLRVLDAERPFRVRDRSAELVMKYQVFVESANLQTRQRFARFLFDDRTDYTHREFSRAK